MVELKVQILYHLSAPFSAAAEGGTTAEGGVNLGGRRPDVKRKIFS